MKVKVVDQNGNPVAGATVISNNVLLRIENKDTDTLADLGSGWYGGSNTIEDCSIDFGDSGGNNNNAAKSKHSYKDDEMPATININVSKTGYTECSCH